MIKMSDTYMMSGSGPKDTVALVMVACGLGDDICALPAVSKLAETRLVTVYVRTLVKHLWDCLPVRVIAVAEDRTRCDNGEMLDPLWDSQAVKRYERIYKLSNWAGWKDDEIGATENSRMQQFADLIGVDLPETFSYESVLFPIRRETKPYVILADESTEVWRSLSKEQGETTYFELSQKESVLWIGESKYKLPDWRSLLETVYNAKYIIAVDNGIAHLAAALGKPLLVIGGFTDVRDIYAQYYRYNTNWSFEVKQGTWGECISPCYRLPSKGFVNKRCCGKYAEPKCIASISTEDILYNLEAVWQ